ncbi:hypothetical protein F5B18DRAFT_656573 [Nemania serpens]|nr:hypothetical protein F5B18DRAFT_656573 [Nemania serpens]
MTTSSAGLLALPLELKMEVLQETIKNSPHDLVNTIRSCKLMYNAYQRNRWSILKVVLIALGPNELALTSAHYHATVAPWRYVTRPDDRTTRGGEGYLDGVFKFCDQHLSKQGTRLGTPHNELTLHIAMHLIGTHLWIHDLAQRVAGIAVQVMSGRSFVFDKPEPSPVEISLVYKSLCIIDLARLLFPDIARLDRRAVDTIDTAFKKFWSCFAPWECAQIPALMNMLAGVPAITSRTGSQTAGMALLTLRGLKALGGLWYPEYKMPAYDKALLKRLNNDGATIHWPFCQDEWQWFPRVYGPPRPGHENQRVILDSKVFEKYDADIDSGPARAWLWRNASGCVREGIDFPEFSDGVTWWAQHEVPGCILSWDLEHLLRVTKGRLPSLATMIKGIGNRHVELPGEIARVRDLNERLIRRLR